METKPDKAVSIIECDMNVRPTCCSIETPMNNFAVSLKLKCFFSQVDFDAPLGYKEPERRPQHQEEPAVSQFFRVK